MRYGSRVCAPFAQLCRHAWHSACRRLRHGCTLHQNRTWGKDPRRSTPRGKKFHNDRSAIPCGGCGSGRQCSGSKSYFHWLCNQHRGGRRLHSCRTNSSPSSDNKGSIPNQRKKGTPSSRGCHSRRFHCSTRCRSRGSAHLAYAKVAPNTIQRALLRQRRLVRAPVPVSGGQVDCRVAQGDGGYAERILQRASSPGGIDQSP